MSSPAADTFETTAEPSRSQRLFERFLRGFDNGWSLEILLAGFVIVWTVSLMLAYSNAGLHPDVMEAWSLGREFAWGNAKHPPLMGWIARTWTSIFPLRDWSFQLLAMVNAALALWSVDLIARRFVKADKRLIILCLLLCLPTYHFHAQRFNANTVLLALWPFATYCFLRSFQTRHAGWALAAGAACAVSMLGKYFSLFLIAGFIVAAVLHPNRRTYLLSSAPWLSVAAGLAVLSPHLWWVWTHNFATFDYALNEHGNNSLGETLGSGFSFIGGAIGYLALPVIFWIAMCGRRWRDILPGLRKMECGPLLLGLIFLGTMIIPVIANIPSRTELTPLWSLPGLFLAIVVLVASAGFEIELKATFSVFAGLLAFHILALILAPLHAWYREKYPLDLGRNYFEQANAEIIAIQQSLKIAKLRTSSGDDALALAISFYNTDHPSFQYAYNADYDWPVPATNMLQSGWVGLCFLYDPTCINWLNNVAATVPTAQRTIVELKSGPVRALMIK